MISIFINILQYDDITYKDFQELSKPRLKLLFNELIDSIEIKEPEMSNPEISRKTPVAITINMKITGYSPKYTIDFIKGMKTEEIEKENSQFFFENRELKKGGRGRRDRTLGTRFWRIAKWVITNDLTSTKSPSRDAYSPTICRQSILNNSCLYKFNIYHL